MKRSYTHLLLWIKYNSRWYFQKLATVQRFMLALTVVVLGGIGFARIASRNYQWCNMNPKLQEDMCELAFKVSNILEDNGIKHWMQLGDSIGLLRHGNMIPWEHDIDICVPSDLFQTAMTILKDPQQGFTYLNKRKNKGGGLWIIVKPEWGPYAAWRFNQPQIVDVWNCDDKFPITGESIQVQKYPYCRKHKFPFPRDLYGYVEGKYGRGWRKPKYEHNVLQCYIWNDSPSARMFNHTVNSHAEFLERMALAEEANQKSDHNDNVEEAPKDGKFLESIERNKMMPKRM